MKLTSLKIKSLPLGKLFCDGGGLYIRLNNPNSGKWAFKYMQNGKSREMGLGPYPEISLQDAHITDAEYREQIDALFAKTKARTEPATTSEFVL